MPTLKERLKHFEDHEKKAGDEYGAEVLYHARKRIAELEAERDTLKDAIRKLRTLLSNDGVYSICRTDGPMTIADAVIIGDVLEAIDEMLEEDA